VDDCAGVIAVQYSDIPHLVHIFSADADHTLLREFRLAGAVDVFVADMLQNGREQILAVSSERWACAAAVKAPCQQQPNIGAQEAACDCVLTDGTWAWAGTCPPPLAGGAAEGGGSSMAAAALEGSGKGAKRPNADGSGAAAAAGAGGDAAASKKKKKKTKKDKAQSKQRRGAGAAAPAAAGPGAETAATNESRLARLEVVTSGLRQRLQLAKSQLAHQRELVGYEP
jgi:hypothetical protein